ncbi:MULTISPECIES: hypothetical protein [Streptomyces]|uniref:hypothetical protein n=1 Tax=Streptomyces TaxID=1883 RepID=UPI00163B8B36|nr:MULTISPECIES: hypothetical protein [Streptomyces]MBC2876955.1 hypothetical protein [Streptomyces sp. TYQ1024]UBI35981.1 hypothetical protein K7I03_05565 [Streptomyces mobaraensis]UKW28574.1 hypothetical protein MCU78_05560 [Streptomyces sp. TYQ1024]
MTAPARPAGAGQAYGARCAECARIKAAYYAAWRAGDRTTAVALTVEMGRHQRAAHA